MRKVLIFVCCILCVSLASCVKSEKETYKMSIENVYLYVDDNNYSIINRDSNVSYVEDAHIICKIKWEYVIKNVIDVKELPIIEYAHPAAFNYYIYLNDELLIENNIEIREYKELNYKIDQHFFNSDVIYSIEGSNHWKITSPGNYKIVYYCTFRRNSEKVECTDSFTFRIL